MELIDITKELFSTPAYPGDPTASLHFVQRIENGDACNLSVLNAGNHNGTHMDAPLHFVENGADISQMDLSRCCGPCVVVQAQGVLDMQQMEQLLQDTEMPERLLLAGEVWLSREAAVAAAMAGVRLIGTQQASIAPADDPAGAHCALLSAEVAVLENLALDRVQPGAYFLTAFPLKNRGAEAAMVRAVLINGSW
ncbi:cyclase family protein [Caproicibacterium argilliputei]|uniref:Cyclase family protein n=1 Tax=Caproicibacterium argilliputei TaxID=3030016 RepID=A0AA97H0P9_9FIRM|nr:cyclase family protein [Caproicibacterium argilliputei]WOC31771.1 cyclase family protein [Caproicibacterium argilliputei]